MHSRWAKEGEAIFDVRGRGGRRHQHLTREQEQELLAPFVQRAEAGGMLTVAEIQQAYQEHTGKEVAPLDDLPAAGSPRLAQGGAASQASQGRRCGAGRL